ncbi:MAG TPA: TolC family protein [Kofleriaceae bacterium]|nr:TolC family protein [Kofleriaceae bacterium]
MKTIASIVLASCVLASAANAQPAVPATATAPGPAPTPAAAAAIAPAPTAPRLSLADALARARQQHPAIRSTQATIAAAHARVDLANVITKPTVTAAGSLVTGSNNGLNGGFFEPALSTGISAQANLRLYDFGLTRANIRAAEANAAASDAVLPTTMLDITSTVTVAYLEAIARERLVVSADATVRNEDAHVDQARRFVAAQAKDPIEVVQAQARAANARSVLAQAQSNAAVALANLRAAIGAVDATDDFAINTDWPALPTDPPPTLATLVASARQHRPEIAQLDRQIAASNATLNAARAGRRPVLNAQAQTQWNPGSNNWSPQPSWSAGLTLSWQFFDGGRAAADTNVASANVANALAQRDSLLISLHAQLESARAQIVAATVNVSASSEAVTAAQAQLKLANARYAAGLGSQIELGDAQTAVTTAEGNLINAEWQLARAWTQLQRAIGE